MNIKLLPCPFCGSSALPCSSLYPNGPVRCSNHSVDSEVGCPISSYAINQDKWNTRATPNEDELKQMERSRDAWQEDCESQYRNVAYYQGLLDRCGKVFGEKAFVCDDGSISEDILRAKVPELVEEMAAELARETHPSPSEDELFESWWESLPEWVDEYGRFSQCLKCHKYSTDGLTQDEAKELWHQIRQWKGKE